MRKLSVHRAQGEEDHVTGPRQRVYLSTNAQADVQSIRQEEFNGRKYTVIPVVAIVETVLQGANSPAPELALASEFGKFPQSWNGRPVVLNHPQISGVFVSASIPDVLENYAFGLMFNARVETKKLLVEAWIDEERADELGGEFADVLVRAAAGEEIEVSVGAFLDVVQHKGELNGRQYEGVWQNVVPDHLAILSKGVKGACSNEDGCGAPRVHSGSEATSAPFRVNCNNDGSPCCDGCANGTGCTQEGPVNIAASNGVTEIGGGQSATNDANGTDAAVPSTSLSSLSSFTDLSELVVEAIRAERRAELLDNFSSMLGINSVPGELVLDDVRCLVRQGLQELLDVSQYDFELLALTTEVAVYYVWGSQGVFSQIRYSLASNGKVTFTGDPEPVNLLTTIQPRQASDHVGGSNASGIGTASSGPLVNSEEGNADMADNGQGGQSAGNGGAGAGSGQGNQDNEQQQGGGASGSEGQDQGQGQEQQQQEQTPNANVASTQSVEDYLKSAPPAIAAVLSSALSAQQTRKETVVKGLLAAKGNRFTEAQLKEMDISVLEGMHAFAAAAAPADFSGRGGSGFDTESSLRTHSANGAPSSVAAAPQNYLGRQPSNGNGAESNAA